MALTRRSLLGRGALLVASGLLTPTFLTRTALAVGKQQAAPGRKNILVVVQLSGGNDGINTVIPFADAEYARLRPTLGLSASEVLTLNDAVGLHPGLAKFKGLYDAGHLAVIQGVGYP